MGSGKDKEFVVGVDLGGTKILAAVFNQDFHIVGRAKIKTKADQDSDSVLRRVARCINEALVDAGVNKKQVRSLGIGSPGPLDPDLGVITFSPNLGWRDVRLKDYLEKEFDFPVVVDNDVNVGTWGEFVAGAGKGAEDIVGIFVGTGIGGGIVINKKLLHGFNKNAGEIGHIVIDRNGPLCNCGVRGCLEAVASRTAITRDIKEAIAVGRKSIVSELAGPEFDNIRSSVLAEAYNASDQVVREVLRNAAEALGIAVGGVVNLLNPERVIIGGGVFEALGAQLMPIVDSVARKTAFKHCIDNVSIVPAKLGDDSGVTGAAHIARERCGS